MQKPQVESTAVRDIGGLPVFDPIKLDLAVIILVALAVTLVIARLDAPQWGELLIMAAVGMGSGVWIALRTRRVVRTCRAQVRQLVHERSDDPE